MATTRDKLFFFVNCAKDTWARVYLNDLPLYVVPFMGPHSRSGLVNYLVRPGENLIEIELLKTGEPNPNEGDTDLVEDALKVQLYRVLNPEAPEGTNLERELLVDLAFPEIWRTSPEEQQHFPFYHRHELTLDYDLAVPIFEDAPTARIPCEGTPELRDAVERLYQCLESRDYDGLLDELSLKFYTDERMAAGEDLQRASHKMNMWRTEIIPFEPVPAEPLDMSMIHFEPRRDGRVAYVTRLDDGFALDAVCQKDPKRRVRTDLLMVQHQGRWRVFA